MIGPLLRVASLGLALALIGCGTTVIQSKKIDYKSQGKKTTPLEVPPDLTAPTQDDRYAVPDLQGKAPTKYSDYSKDREAAPEKTAGNILPTSTKVRVERAGSQRWLVVNAGADEVWPAVKEFWNELGFIINVERPEAGVMETDWAENRAKIAEGGIRKWVSKVLDDAYSTPERDKFRTRIERSADKAGTEIYISHRGMYEVYVSEGKSQTKWQPRPADPELEAEMLQRLMAKFNADDARAAQTEVSAKGEAKARIAAGASGVNELTVVDGFERAWRRVGLALDRIGFTVEDRDRSKGLYFVRYVEPNADKTESKGGLLSRLAFWRKNDTKAQQGAQYRIQLAQAGDLTQVAVQNSAGAPEKSDATNRILKLLYDQLK
jgi:outer membrane protein assembly factor BamC